MVKNFVSQKNQELFYNFMITLTLYVFTTYRAK
jgi:hypothetical protein